MAFTIAYYDYSIDHEANICKLYPCASVLNGVGWQWDNCWRFIGGWAYFSPFYHLHGHTKKAVLQALNNAVRQLIADGYMPSLTYDEAHPTLRGYCLYLIHAYNSYESAPDHSLFFIKDDLDISEQDYLIFQQSIRHRDPVYANVDGMMYMCLQSPEFHAMSYPEI